MPRLLIPLLLLLLSLLPAGCASRASRSAMDRAETLMDSRPDSALAILRAIDPASLATPFDDEPRARHALLLSQALDKTCIDIADDSLISIAYDHYATSPSADPRRRMLAYLYFAKVKRNAGELEVAIPAFLEALAYAEGERDILYLSRINSSLANVYSRAGLFEEAAKCDSICAVISKQQNRIDWLTDNYLNLGEDYLALSNPSVALRYADSASLCASDPESFQDIADLKIQSFRQLGNYAAVDSMFSLMEGEGRPIASRIFTDEALALHRLGRKEEALAMLDSARHTSTNMTDTIAFEYVSETMALERSDHKEAFNSLSRIYKRQNDYIREEKYLAPIRIQAAYEKEKARALHESVRRQNERMTIGIAIVMLIIAILLLSGRIVFLSYRKKQVEQGRSLLALSQEIAALKEAASDSVREAGRREAELSNSVEIMRSEMDKARSEVISVKSEMQRRSIDAVVGQFSWINQLGQLYIDAMVAKREHSDRKLREKFEKELEKAKSKAFVSRLQEIVNENRANLIERAVSRCPGLKESEIRLLTYMCVGLSPNIMGLLMEKTVRAIYNIKCRMKSRLQEEAPDILSELSDMF